VSKRFSQSLGVVAVIACGLSAAVAFAQAPAQGDGTHPPAAAQSSAKPAEPDKICKTITVTGSRLGGHKICRTKAEWDETARQAREMVEDSGQKALTRNCVAGATGGGGC